MISKKRIIGGKKTAVVGSWSTLARGSQQQSVPIAFADTDLRRIERGYHGTSFRCAYEIVETQRIGASKNPWDWLGTGAYFFLTKAKARDWAIKMMLQEEAQKSGAGVSSADYSRVAGQAAVVSAEIQLGYCLDLSSARFSNYLAAAHADLEKLVERGLRDMPENRDLRRDLDCAVINLAIKNHLPDTQTVVAPFQEGPPRL